VNGLDDASSLREAAAAIGVALDVTQLEQLRAFEDEVLRWNRAINLVARADSARFRPRHLLDSLSLVPLIRGPHCIDLGTGAGLPGLPLAIAMPDVTFELVERSERKARFLRHVIRQLQLQGVVVRCDDAATVQPEHAAETVVSRAMAPPHRVWVYAERVLAPGGRLLILSRTHGHASDADSLSLPPGTQWRREASNIPGLAGEHEVLIVERP
jgi:16S rRNA (guanine527-N7)-methyltransferase